MTSEQPTAPLPESVPPKSPETPVRGGPPSQLPWGLTPKDIVAWSVGSFLLVNESLSSFERPYLIAAGGALLGLPFAIQADRRT